MANNNPFGDLDPYQQRAIASEVVDSDAQSTNAPIGQQMRDAAVNYATGRVSDNIGQAAAQKATPALQNAALKAGQLAAKSNVASAAASMAANAAINHAAKQKANNEAGNKSADSAKDALDKNKDDTHGEIKNKDDKSDDKNKAGEKGGAADEVKGDKDAFDKGNKADGDKKGLAKAADGISKAANDTKNDAGKNGKKGEDDANGNADKLEKVAGKESDAGDDLAKIGKQVGKHAVKQVGSMAGQMLTNPAVGMMALMGLLKGLIGKIIAAVKGLIQGVIGFFKAVFAPVVAAFNGVAGFFSGIFGGSAAAGAAAAWSMVLAMMIAPAAFTANMISEYKRFTDDGVTDSCVDAAVATAKNAAASGEEISSDSEENGKQLISVMKAYGLKDNQIAGMLGNFSHESGIDPTSIEGIYDEPRQMGSKKTKAASDFDSYVSDTLFPMYAGRDLNWDFYTASDNKKYPGIGLAQWTGENARQLIAKATNGKWNDLGYQLAYILANGSPASGKGFFEEYNKQDFASASDAAQYFLIHFEGNPGSDAITARKNAAESWKSKMSSLTIDSSYGQSIVSMSQSLGGAALNQTVAKAVSTCVTALKGDNSTLYNAALAYAYDKWEEGNGNNGTALYQELHEAIFPGDPYFMSCDRGVAVAVRWSGSDDDYPAGDTTQQGTYLSNSPKWDKVIDGYKDSDYNQLKPGDVFVTQTNGHTFMYTGVEATMKAHPKAAEGSDNVSASFGQRSPGCSKMGNYTEIDSRPYNVFRLVKPDNSDKYTSLGSGALVTGATGAGSSSGSSASNLRPSGGSNPYPYGQCTWWAYDRRRQLNKYAPDHYGNAKDWANSARAEGKSVDGKAKKGDIVVFQPGALGADSTYGHVAVVEDVAGDKITISESNVMGLGVISTRIITAGSGVSFIH